MAVKKFIPTLALALMAVSASGSVDLIQSLCACKPREVGESGSRKDWPGYRSGGIRWHYSIEEAKKIASFERKLVFWYHVAGDLDKEGC